MSFQHEVKEEMSSRVRGPALDDETDEIDLLGSLLTLLQAHHMAVTSSQPAEMTPQHHTPPDDDDDDDDPQDDPTIFQRVRIIEKVSPSPYSTGPWNYDNEYVQRRINAWILERLRSPLYDNLLSRTWEQRTGRQTSESWQELILSTWYCDST